MSDNLAVIFISSILGNILFFVYIILDILKGKPKKKISAPNNNDAYELAQNNFCIYADKVMDDLENDVVACIKTGHKKIIRKYSTADDRSESLVEFIEVCFKHKGYYVYTDVVNDNYNDEWFEVIISWESVNNEV